MLYKVYTMADKLIRLKPNTHHILKEMGKKDESFDMIINKIIKGKVKQKC